MTILFSVLIVLLILSFLFLRILLIQKEIDKTGKVKKRGILETLLKTRINEDIERRKTIDYTETRERFLKREILRNTKKE